MSAIFKQESKVVKGETVINIPAIETWPITHLRKACKNNHIKGYTKMNREQLVQAVKQIIEKM